MNIQIRIHREWNDVSGVMVSLFEKCEKGFVFQHPEDEEVARTHIHGYMFEPKICRKSISEQIAKKLNLKGNVDFSTSETCGKRDKRPIDISGAWTYGSKFGTIAPSFQKNISPALLEELRVVASNWTFNKLASKSAPTSLIVLKEIKVKTKPTLYQHVNECVKSIMDTRPDIYKADIGDMRRQVFELSFSYIQSNELFMGKYKQLDFMDMVLTKLNCSEYKNMLFHDFVKRTSFERI